MALGDVIARLSVVLGMDTAAFEQGATVAEKRIAQSQRKIAAIGDRMSDVGARLSLALSAPLAAFGVASFNAASDAAELQSAFNQTFGALSESMNEWARVTGDAMGRSTQELQRAANTFGIFFNQAAPTRAEAAEMSKAFTVLAQDLASFYNVSENDALQKLRSGLAGESEPLRDFGVFLNEASVKAKGLEMGLGGLTGELTEQEKILARYQLILEGTTNAQGDVARTSSGTANRMREAKAAFEELQVVIGTKLLPVLTPLIEGIASILNRFSQLPAPVQSAAVVIGAIAIALGPLLMVLGPLVSAFAPFFATVKAMAAAGTFVALKAGLVGIAAAAWPIAAALAAVYLAWKNWDTIGPALEQLWSYLESTFGPPLRALLDAVSEAVSALWSGPLGTELRAAAEEIIRFGQLWSDTMGPALVTALKLTATVIAATMHQIANVIRLVTAVLSGDWSRAWEAGKAIVAAVVDPIVGFARSIFTGVKTWLQDKLGAVLDWVGTKTRMVSDFFKDMYIAVVGNSWVPDMVDGIAAQMQRLETVMVRPAEAAAAQVSEAMRQMAGETQALLDRLFPEVRRLLDYRRDAALLDQAGLSPAQLEEARRRLGAEFSGVGNAPHEVIAASTENIYKGLRQTSSVLDEFKSKSEIVTVAVAQTFRDMADQTLAAVDRMAQAIRGGGFLDILGSVLNLGLQLGSIGAFGSKIAANINRPRKGYANGTGSAAPGLAMVGERGPELVSFRGGERVYNASQTRGMMTRRGGGNTYHFQGNLLTPEFWEQIHAGDRTAAFAGADMAQSSMAMARKWSLTE